MSNPTIEINWLGGRKGRKRVPLLVPPKRGLCVVQSGRLVTVTHVESGLAVARLYDVDTASAVMRALLAMKGVNWARKGEKLSAVHGLRDRVDRTISRVKEKVQIKAGAQ